MSDIQSRAGSATAWTVFGYGLSQIFRLAGNIILTRLLVPEAFGIMALVSIVMFGLAMLSDVGIGPAIVKEKRANNPEFLNTAWTMQIVRGMLMWACVLVLAIPFARFYNEPSLALILSVAGVTAVLNTFASTAIYIENRALRQSRIAILELVTQIAGLAVIISWALVAPSVWALVWGGIVTSALKSAASHLIFDTPIKNRLCWDRKIVREIAGFGKWILLSSSLTFAAVQIDRLTLGKLVPLDMVGVYTIGWFWAQFPLQLSAFWFDRVYFPLVADKIRKSSLVGIGNLAEYRRAVLFVVIPVIAAIFVGMPGLFEVLYTPAFKDGGPIASIITLGVWSRILSNFRHSSLIANGKPQYSAAGMGSTTVLFLILVGFFFSRWGMNGVALSFAVSQIGFYIACAIGAHRYGFLKVYSDFGYSTLLAVTIALLFGIKQVVSGVSTSPVILSGAIFGLGGILALAGTYYFLIISRKRS